MRHRSACVLILLLILCLAPPLAARQGRLPVARSAPSAVHAAPAGTLPTLFALLRGLGLADTSPGNSGPGGPPPGPLPHHDPPEGSGLCPHGQH